MDQDRVGEVFGHYATAQAMRAVHLLDAHRRDDTDCCRDCGRPHPCATRRHAANLILHFGHWDSGQLCTAPLAGNQVMNTGAVVYQ